MIQNKKILTIILIFFAIIFLFSGKSFADYEAELIDYSLDLTDSNGDIVHLDEIYRPVDTDYNNFIIFYGSEQFKFIWFTQENIPYVENNKFYFKGGLCNSYLQQNAYYGDFDYYWFKTYFEYRSSFNTALTGSNSILIYTTIDIKDENNEVVFHAPVTDNQYNLQPILEKTKVGEIVTKEVGQALLVVIKRMMIVVVSLAALSIGLLILWKTLRHS